MIQFDEHIFQMGWFNHQLVLLEQIVSLGDVCTNFPSMFLAGVEVKNESMQDESQFYPY